LAEVYIQAFQTAIPMRRDGHARSLSISSTRQHACQP